MMNWRFAVVKKNVIEICFYKCRNCRKIGFRETIWDLRKGLEKCRIMFAVEPLRIINVITFSKKSGLVALCIILFFSCVCCNWNSADKAERNAFINNPFPFTILKNYSDDFTSIGTVLSNRSICPLQKENIADPAFCMIRELEYEGLFVRIFSFDVLQGGTAEYIVNSSSVSLRNGLGIGSSSKNVVRALGKPYKIKGDTYVWRSDDLHNYLAFRIADDKVIAIRWHEEREPSYKDVVVWSTKY